MKLIGLTGGIATGKSLVSGILRDQGLDVVDADVLAREVVLPGSFGLRALVQVFGVEILNDGNLDRSKLRQKIFSDNNARLVVERIVHPLIQWRSFQEFQRLIKAGRKLAFYDAALIFEKDMVSLFDLVTVVNAPSPLQLERLIARDKMDRESAMRLISSQWPMEKKIAGAHFVIENGGSLSDVKKAVSDFLDKLKI